MGMLTVIQGASFLRAENLRMANNTYRGCGAGETILHPTPLKLDVKFTDLQGISNYLHTELK